MSPEEREWRTDAVILRRASLMATGMAALWGDSLEGAILRRDAGGLLANAQECEEQANLLAIEGLDLSPESLYAPCALTRTALYGEG